MKLNQKNLPTWLSIKIDLKRAYNQNRFPKSWFRNNWKSVSRKRRRSCQIQSRKTSIIGFLIGQVMKLTHGQTDPASAQNLLLKHLQG